MNYTDLVALGYSFTKPQKLYYVAAPCGKKLGIYSESKEALKVAQEHANNNKKKEKL